MFSSLALRVKRVFVMCGVAALLLSSVLPPAAYASGGGGTTTQPPSGETSANSGLVFAGYTVHRQNDALVLTDIFEGDRITLDARFSIPETIAFTGDIRAQITGGGYTGAVNSVNTDIASRTVTVSFNLTYGGGSGYVMFSLSGIHTISGGQPIQFSDPRNVSISESRLTDTSGTGVIEPDGPSEPPRFSVDLSAKFPVARAGEKYVFEIPVKNIGKQEAKDITVTLDPGSDSEAFPFEYDRYAFTARIAELRVNDIRTARFEVDVLPTAKDGQHTINVKFSGRSAVGVGSAAESSETIAIRIQNNNTEPKLTVEHMEIAQMNGGTQPVTVDKITPGAAFMLSVRVRNSGTLAAKNVKLTLGNLKADGISTDNSPDTQYVEAINGGRSAELLFKLTCSENITVDRTDLSLAMAFTDVAAAEHTGTASLFIPIFQEDDGEDKYTAFVFENFKSPSATLGEGSSFSVSFDIRNTGDVPMRDVKVTYQIGAEFIGKSLNTQMLKPIASQGVVSMKYDFEVSKSYTTGNFPIAFAVEYTPDRSVTSAATGGSGDTGIGGGSGTDTDSETGTETGNGGSGTTPAPGGSASSGSGEKVSGTQYVGIQLFKPEEITTTTTTTTEPKDSVPKIIISNYEYTPKEVVAGQTVNITLTFFNTSMSQTVKNIKIMLESETPSTSSSGSGASASAGVFTPVEGSNTFYIENIAPRKEISKSITLMIRGDAEAKAYPLYSSFEYEDQNSNPITSRESISIPVTQVTKVMIGAVQINGEAIVGQPLNINCNFINMGRTTLNNLFVNTDGPFSAQATEYYAGNPQPGYEDFFDGNVTPEATGDQVGYIVITYEDAAGNSYEERKEFQFTAIDMGGMGDIGGMFPGMEGPGGMMPGMDGPGGVMPGMEGELPPRMEGAEGAAEDGRTFTDMAVEQALKLWEWVKADWALWIVIVVGAIILIVVIVKVVRTIKRKRLALELDKRMEAELAALNGSDSGMGGAVVGDNVSGDARNGSDAGGGDDGGSGEHENT